MQSIWIFSSKPNKLMHQWTFYDMEMKCKRLG
uniref:Uncharacterized protein n=1 Tax=Rhizophora mucronata TaxID=61149 RepID=A0A2P2PZQ5_RHIMU